MTVHFIGAGPGAADLITVRGRDLLARCEVCLYPGSMTPTELLAYCPPEAQRIDTANLNLDEIIERLVAAHLAGHDVARLCSGDPSLYSAVAEQMRRLDAADVPYEVTPGVPAFAAAPKATNKLPPIPIAPRLASTIKPAPVRLVSRWMSRSGTRTSKRSRRPWSE